MQQHPLASDINQAQSVEASTSESIKAKAGKLLKKQVRRAQVLKGMSETIVGGYRAITKVDGWGEVPKRDDLPRYNKAFCRNMAAAFHINVVAVEPIPETHGLWAANHVSWMDIPVMGSVVPAFSYLKLK